MAAPAQRVHFYAAQSCQTAPAAQRAPLPGPHSKRGGNRPPKAGCPSSAAGDRPPAASAPGPGWQRPPPALLALGPAGAFTAQRFPRVTKSSLLPLAADRLPARSGLAWRGAASCVSAALPQRLRPRNLPGPRSPPAREPGPAPCTPRVPLLGGESRRAPAARASPPGAAPRHRCGLQPGTLRFPGPSAAGGRWWCPGRSPRRPGAASCAQHTPASCSRCGAPAHPGVAALRRPSPLCVQNRTVSRQLRGRPAPGSASPQGTLQGRPVATRGVRPPCRPAQGGSCLRPPAGAASAGVTATPPAWSLPTQAPETQRAAAGAIRLRSVLSQDLSVPENSAEERPCSSRDCGRRKLPRATPRTDPGASPGVLLADKAVQQSSSARLCWHKLQLSSLRSLSDLLPRGRFSTVTKNYLYAVFKYSDFR